VAEHTVHVDAFGGLHPSDEELAELYDLLAGRPELIGPSVSANAERGSVGLTVTVEAATRELAQVSAGKALGEAVVALGLVDAWTRAGGRQAVVV
jgi:hypothetical protein